MTVYLIHFTRRYKHAAHYIGSTSNLARRLTAHRSGVYTRSSALMAAVVGAGIEWEVARTWEGGYELEMRLKRWHGGAQLCPICRAERARTHHDAEQPDPAGSGSTHESPSAAARRRHLAPEQGEERQA